MGLCLEEIGVADVGMNEHIADMYGLTSTHRLSNGFVRLHGANAAHATTYCLATFFRDGVQTFEHSGR